MWNHQWMHSWNQPVPSNKAMVSCLVKQQEPLIGFESTTAHYKKRLFTSYNNKRSLILLCIRISSLSKNCQKTRWRPFRWTRIFTKHMSVHSMITVWILSETGLLFLLNWEKIKTTLKTNWTQTLVNSIHNQNPSP